MNPKKIVAQSPGKLILLGEYAVLEGAPALVAAVNRFARVTVTQHDKDTFVVSSPAVGIKSLPFRVDGGGKICYLELLSPEKTEKLRFFSAAIEMVWQGTLEKKIAAPANILLDTGNFFLSENSAKLGLGSSAALTIALLGGLSEYNDKTIITNEDRFQLFNRALEVHRAAQGNIGSGIDVAASAFGGVVQYQLNKNSGKISAEIAKIALPDDLHFLFIWSGKPASTRELVRKVHQFQDKDSRGYQKIMDKMQELSSAGCTALAGGKTTEFLEIAGEYHRVMDELGRLSGAPIVSPEHRQIAEIVRASGAAYKPSGAGGGDLGIAFGQSKEVMENCAFQLKKAGFKSIDLTIVSNGIQVNQP